VKNIVLNTNKGEILLSLELDKKIEKEVLWSFSEVYLSEKLSPLDEKNFTDNEYIGSSSLFSDESWAFNDLLLLDHIALYVPEENIDDTSCLESWLSTTSINALPKIKTREKFGIESPSDYRLISKEHNTLLCLSEDSIIVSKNSFRVSINNSIEILVKNDRYCGFLLKNPFDRLVPFSGAFPEEASLKKASDPFKKYLIDYLAIANEPDWHKLENQDPQTKNEIILILEGLSNQDKNSISVRSLMHRCSNLLEEYY